MDWMDWAGLDCTAPRSTGLDCTLDSVLSELERVGMDWTGLDWTGNLIPEFVLVWVAGLD